MAEQSTQGLSYITDKFTITKREKSPEGYLVVRDSKLARIGILNYRASEIRFMQGAPENLPDEQVIRVFRGPEELFKPEVLDSFKSKPMTLKHPQTLVDSRTIKRDSVGFGKDDVTAQGDFMTATLVITDFDTVKEVEEGTGELSLGYTADIIWQPGVDKDGNPFDAIQRNIRGNHIAIVPRGRCGTECKISDSQPTNKNRGKNMPEPQVILDGISYDCPAQTAQAFDKILDSNTTEIKALKDNIKNLKDDKKDLEDEDEDEKKEAKKREDALQAKLDDALSVDLDSLVEQRSSVVTTAKSVIKDFDPSGKSNDDIRKAVVTDACKDLSIEGKSQDYINARFDALAETAKTNGSAIIDAMTDHADAGKVTDDAKGDSNLSYSEKVRQKKMEDNRNGGTK